MTRPFFKMSIVDLEQMFAEKGTEKDVLSDLVGELLIRETSRAQALLKKVNDALAGGVVADMPKEVSVKPFELMSNAMPITVAEPTKALPQAPSRQKPQSEVRKVDVLNQKRLAVDEARKILGCSSQVSWSELEAKRRELVKATCPDDFEVALDIDKSKARTAASKINLAFLSLTTLHDK